MPQPRFFAWSCIKQRKVHYKKQRKQPTALCPPSRVQVRQLSNPRLVYTQLMDMLARLAGLGLVHCDYNEFNLLVCAGLAFHLIESLPDLQLALAA